MEPPAPLRAAGVAPMLLGGLALLTIDQVRQVLQEADREGWIILGLDGFELVGDRVRPDPHQIADWSGLPEDDHLSARSIEVTRRFLDSVAKDDRLYEVVISWPD